ncbi:hypothetical protein Dimus_004885 [Dionaea muscipula]
MLISNSSPSVSSTRETSAPLSLGRTGTRTRTRTRSLDSELSVFGAERYFREELDEENMVVKRFTYPREERHEKEARVRESVASAPSCCSETVYKPKKAGGLWFFNGFQSNSSCCKSHWVYTQQDTNAPCHGTWTRKNGEVRRPKLVAQGGRKLPQPAFQVKAREETVKSGNRSIESEVSMITWDSIPKVPENMDPHSIRSSRKFEDVESDASSDLFEIENLEGVGLHGSSQQTSISSCLTSTSPCKYEPSKLSIEWSVITARPAASVLDGDKQTVKSVVLSGNSRVNKAKRSSQQHGGLLGYCKSHKAVNVVEAAKKINGKPKFHGQLWLGTVKSYQSSQRRRTFASNIFPLNPYRALVSLYTRLSCS